MPILSMPRPRPAALNDQTHRSCPEGGAVPCECLRMLTKAMAKLAPTAGEMMCAVEAFAHRGLPAKTSDSGVTRA